MNGTGPTPTFYNPVRIRTGRGSLRTLSDLLGDRTAVLITTPGAVRRGAVAIVRRACGPRLVHCATEVRPHPTVASVQACFSGLPRRAFDVVIGLGGGSALDTAKAVALLAGGSVEPSWLDTRFRRGASIPDPIRAKPLIAVPTTSGTGSEVTPWATVWDETTGAKYSLADQTLFPECALLDSELTDALPYDTTLFTSLDALSHAMEAIWNRNANPVSDGLAARAIGLWAASMYGPFRKRYRRPDVRESLQHASLLAGLASSNTKTALAHAMSYPLTARRGMPHGLAVGFALPELLQVNYRRDPDRVGIIVRALECDTAGEAVRRLRATFEAADVPARVRHFLPSGFDPEAEGYDLLAPGRAENNIAPATQAEAAAIIRSALLRSTDGGPLPAGTLRRRPAPTAGHGRRPSPRRSPS